MHVCVLGIGGPAGFNVAMAAKDAGHTVFGVDSAPEHLAWPSEQGIACWRFDGIPKVETLVLPQPEKLVLEAARNPEVLYHGPPAAVIEKTQDKASGADFVSFISDPIPDHLHLAKDRFGLPFWLRARHGAGAKGALRVDDLRAAFHWIRLWDVLGREVEWIAEPYLPGRDFSWTGLFHEGDLVAGFARERLEWIYPHLTLSGRTGTPTIAEVVHDEFVSAEAQAAVYELGDPHGVYCVDLREADDGTPVVTEINAGRYATTVPLYRAFGPNIVDLQIRLAYGQNVEPLGDNIYPAGKRLMRHIDMGLVAA